MRTSDSHRALGSSSLIESSRSDIRLKTALSEFQQNLSPDQKNQYDQYNVTPTSEDVLSLMDEINKKYSSSKSRVFAGRMSPILQSIQQYSSAIDTLVQVNQIAMLIWGSVKLVIRVSLPILILLNAKNFLDWLKFCGVFRKIIEMVCSVRYLLPSTF